MTPRPLDEIAADMAKSLALLARKGYHFEVATAEEIEQAKDLGAEYAASRQRAPRMPTERAAFRVAYIAAPFAPWEGETTDPTVWGYLGVEDNLGRVRKLAAHAFRHESGIAPVYIHEAIALGVYGNDENPEERERGLQAAALIAESIAVAGGELWLLELPNGRLSHGTAFEAAAFLRAAKRAGLVATVRRFKALSCYNDGVICLGIEHVFPNPVKP